MSQSLEELGVNTEGALTPKTRVVCWMKSGAKIRICTPLLPEDVIKLWNAKRGTIKILSGENAYAVIKKHRVDFVEVFLVPEFGLL